jgi:hypothetical protein
MEDGSGFRSCVPRKSIALLSGAHVPNLACAKSGASCRDVPPLAGMTYNAAVAPAAVPIATPPTHTGSPVQYVTHCPSGEKRGVRARGVGTSRRGAPPLALTT